MSLHNIINKLYVKLGHSKGAVANHVTASEVSREHLQPKEQFRIESVT